MIPVQLIHTPDYLGYRLGDGHPTRPERAENLVRLAQQSSLSYELVEPTAASEDELLWVHSPGYINEVRSGWHPEWDGHRPQLHHLASLIVGGTLGAARRISYGEVTRAFHPMGAKHHAQRDTASGFCIFNDMAIAATFLADAGMKVLYVDWDAHHGDGVEFLLEHRSEVMTASIHNGQIFPGTGQVHRPEAAAYNWPLSCGATGTDLLSALDKALDLGAEFQPDVVLLAAGADGHRADPLGGLAYELPDFRRAAIKVSEFSLEHCAGRLLVGGAGGYRANDWTPPRLARDTWRDCRIREKRGEVSDLPEDDSPAQPNLNTRYYNALGIARGIAGRRYEGGWSVADREDLVSEVMIKYWVKFGENGGSDNPRAWLSSVLSTTAIDMHRATELRPAVPSGDMRSVESWMDGWLGAVEHTGPSKKLASSTLIKQVLSLVSEQERELLTWKYLYRQSTAEIARQTGTSSSATSQAVHRAKVRLIEALTAEPELFEELRAAMPRPY